MLLHFPVWVYILHVPSAARMIGVITTDLADPYQAAIWRGIQSVAEQQGLGLITFVGSHPRSLVPSEMTSNIAYQIAQAKNVDGIIAIVSALSGYTRSNEIAALLKSKHGLPWVSVGARVGHAPAVVVDGSAALEKLTRHLVQDHGRRRFALIAGPDEHPEVQQRHDAVRLSLRREGVELDPRLMVAGNFRPQSGATAMRTLLERNIEFDAVVCMNDRMAVAAIDTLREVGLRVPEDVSVTGYDGIPESRSLIRPLTTVVQPLFALGQEAVKTLLTVLDSGYAPDGRLHCGLVIGESCGCNPVPARNAHNLSSTACQTREEKAVVARMSALAQAGNLAEFGRVVNSAVTNAALAGEDPLRWNDILSSIRSECHAPNAEAIFEFGRSLVVETYTRVQSSDRHARQTNEQTLQLISASLAGSFELDRMLESLRAGLEQLRIGQGYMALFSSTSGSTRTATLVMSPDTRLSSKRGGWKFPTSQILPVELGTEWKTRNWVLIPLVFQDEALGYLLLPGGIAEASIYGNLKDQVSSTLKGALLLDQVRSHQRKLERDVATRTREIMKVNADLTAEIARRAALEQDVVEVSNHTMERIGQDLHDDLSQHLAGIAMLATVSEETLSKDGRAEADAVSQIASLLRNSVVRIKQIARGLMPAGLEAHGLSAAIDSLVDSVRKSYPVTIEFRTMPEFSLEDTNRALQIYRIVQEALLNAVRHSGSERVSVLLRSERARGRVLQNSSRLLSAEVIDWGRGIPDGVPTDGLGLRIMRYRAGMAGAELLMEPNRPGTRVSCRFTETRRRTV